jgi:ABC-type transport system involved in multi-copper enzyme maturation permease subunit
VARVEARRRVFGRGAIAVLILAGAALASAFLRVLFLPASQRVDLVVTTRDFAESFHYFLILFVTYFGCAGLFTNLFRGEILDRSLHYTLLAPLRREVVVLGKYLGGVVAATLVFSLTALVSMVLFFLAHGPARAGQFLLSGSGLGTMASYMLVVALACVGYGALFLLFGLLFRNPMVPAVVVLGWEYLVPFLPPALKLVSVVHHLGSLEPVPIQRGPFAIMAEPTPAPLAVLGLLAVSATLLAVAAWRARRLEVSYAAE